MDLRKQISAVYRQGDLEVQPPGDAFRSAIQRVISDEPGIKQKYGNSFFEPDFNKVVDKYYDSGNPPSTLKVPEVEARHPQTAQSEPKVQ
jgi:hypothetical protein